MDLRTDATAEKLHSSPLCILALNKTQPASIEIYGNASLKAKDCAVQSNSSDGSGLKLYGSSSFASAADFGVTGGHKGDNWSPEPIGGVDRVVDPFADLPFPDNGPCINAKSKLSKSEFELEPGTYCGGLNIGAHAVVTGDEVMIAFGGADSFLYLLSGADVNLTSPTNGTYKNMQFMSDRDLSQSMHEEE
jgi:hypothetical protein